MKANVHLKVGTEEVFDFDELRFSDGVIKLDKGLSEQQLEDLLRRKRNGNDVMVTLVVK